MCSLSLFKNPNTMALVNVLNVLVLDNPTAFSNPFQFEVTVECLQELPDGRFPTEAFAGYVCES